MIGEPRISNEGAPGMMARLNAIRKSKTVQRMEAVAAFTISFGTLTFLAPPTSYLDDAIYLSGLSVLYGITLIAIGRGGFDFLSELTFLKSNAPDTTGIQPDDRPR